MNTSIHFENFKLLLSRGLYLSLLILILSSFANTVVAATYTVTNTADSGAGSLRQAIIDANNNPGLDNIAFNINSHAAGPFTIQVVPTSSGGLGPLPIISGPVVIDGFTQAGSAIHAIELSGDLLPANFTIVAPTANSSGYPAALLLVGRDAVTGNKLSSDPSGSTIRGLMINKFPRSAIYLYGVDNTTIVGNYIGLDPTGQLSGYHNSRTDIANAAVISTDVRLEGSNNNYIGTTAANYSQNIFDVQDRNLLGASGGFPVGLTDINFNANGFNTLTCPNNIPDFNASGPVPGACRHILLGSSHNVIQGNYFGLNQQGNHYIGGYCLNGQRPPGTVAAPCSAANAIFSIGRSAVFMGSAPTGVAAGISVTSPANMSNGFNQIGGLVTNQGNVISGTLSQALNVQAPKTTIQGNIIGLDATGMTANNITGSRSDGIRLSNASWGNLVENNIIANSDLFTNTSGVGIGGISIGANVQNIPKGPYDNLVRYNVIGTNRDGTLNAGNLQGGISIFGDVSSTLIKGNLIKNNGISANFAGVIMQGINITTPVAVQLIPKGISIQSNSIFSNAGLGIDLNPSNLATTFLLPVGNGPTLNDPLDADTAGPNNLQNFPVLNGQRSFINPALVQVWGSLDSKPNQSYLIQVFSNVLADPSGYGEGQMLIGEMVVNTDGSGHVNYNFPAKLNMPVGSILTSTATDLLTGDTSEFSEMVNIDAKGNPTAYENASGAAGGGNNEPMFDHCLDPASAEYLNGMCS